MTCLGTAKLLGQPDKMVEVGLWWTNIPIYPNQRKETLEIIEKHPPPSHQPPVTYSADYL